MQRIRGLALASTLAFILITSALAVSFGMSSGNLGVREAAAQPPFDERIDQGITVTGEGRVTVEPDQAEVALGVQVQDDDLDQALDEANTRMEDVIAALTDLGIDEEQIRTTTFSINANRDFEQPEQPITGFTVTNLVQVTVDDIDMIADVLDAGLSAGANTVNNIAFTIGDVDAALRQAREEAFQDAHSTAEHLADLAGVSLGRTLSITATPTVPSPPRPFDEAFAREEAVFAEQAPPIEPGQQEIVVTVTATWAIER